MTSYTLEDFTPDPNNKYIYIIIFSCISLFSIYLSLYI